MPNPFPPGTGYGHNPSLGAPSGYGGAPSSTQGGLIIIDDLTPAQWEEFFSYGKKGLPAWVTPPKYNGLLGPVLAKSYIGTQLYFSWKEFGHALRWNEFMQYLPYGNWHMKGYEVVCGPLANCTAAGWFQGWTGEGSMYCVEGCGFAHALVSFVYTGKSLWNAAVGGQIKYGSAYWTGLNYYFRPHLILQRASQNVRPDGKNWWNNLRYDPGLMEDPFVQSQAEDANPMILPNVLPEVLPIGEAMPFPAPRPYWWPMPEPLPGVEPAYQPLPTPQPAKQPLPVMEPQPGVILDPAKFPSVTIGVQGPRPTRPLRHKNKPPSKGHKDLKGGGSKMAWAAKTVFGAATETLDFIDATWKAMGTANGWQTKVKGKATTPAQKVVDLWNAIGDPKFNAAVFWAALPVELAKNEVTDRAVGKLGQLGKAANKASGARGLHGAGYQFGGGLTGGVQSPGKGTYDHSQDLPTAGWL